MLVLGILGQPETVRSHPGDLFGEWDSGWFHDSASVLVEDGEVVAAIPEERVSRRKHVGKFPVQAIRYCLAARGIDLSAVDFVAFGEEGGDGAFRQPGITRDSLARVLSSELGCEPPPLDAIEIHPHHYCHAASAYFVSGFSSALVYTMDGFGDGISGLIAHGRGTSIEPIATTAVGDSLGGFYTRVTRHLGFGRHGEYKLMGLAPYGDPQRYKSYFHQQYTLDAEGRHTIRPGWASTLAEQFGPPRGADVELEQWHMDLAAGMQSAFEEILLHQLTHFRHVTGHEYLCLAGGSAQNSTAIGRIIRTGLFRDVFVQPASNDAGVALGAALATSCRVTGKTGRRLRSVLWGASLPDDAAIEDELSLWRDDFLTFERVPDPCRRAAAMLAEGSILGWVQGRSEFGPRALGNRSILADPRPAIHKDVINALVKRRQRFQPLAPSVVEEGASRFFSICDQPFMTAVAQVAPEHRVHLGAVTHVDGSARVQTVSRDVNPRFWTLLTEFEKLSGYPILLNTSFNNHLEPIVETVHDAIACFLTTGLHGLVIGDYVVHKRPVAPERYLDLVPRLPIHAALMCGQRTDVRSTFWCAVLSHSDGQQRVEVALSETMHRILSREGSGRTLREVAEEAGPLSSSALASLGQEAFELWVKRVVRMEPRAQRKAAQIIVPADDAGCGSVPASRRSDTA